MFLLLHLCLSHICYMCCTPKKFFDTNQFWSRTYHKNYIRLMILYMNLSLSINSLKLQKFRKSHFNPKKESF